MGTHSEARTLALALIVLQVDAFGPYVGSHWHYHWKPKQLEKRPLSPWHWKPRPISQVVAMKKDIPIELLAKNLGPNIQKFGLASGKMVNQPSSKVEDTLKRPNLLTEKNMDNSERNIFNDLQSIELLSNELHLQEELEEAANLANDILDDVRNIVGDIRSDENKLRATQKPLEQTLQRALEVVDPSDPARLLKLS